MKVCGVDAGAGGAIAFVEGLKETIYDMPVTKMIDAQGVVDYDKVRSILACEKPDVIIVELQQAHGTKDEKRRMSAKNAMTMGRNYQALLTGIKMYADKTDTPVVMVRPQVWKKTLGLIAPKGTSVKDKKEITANFVMTVFPKARIRGMRGGLKDGRSDALAIAEFGRQRYA